MSTLFFAAVAVIVLWKLWTVLGSRTGSERPPFNPVSARKSDTMAEAPAANNVIRLPGAAPAPAREGPENERWKGFATPGSAVAASFDAMAALDPGFSPKAFIDGAKVAYELVVLAFAAGDRKGLRALTAKDVFDGFDAAIADRERRGETAQTTFVSIDRAVIEEAHLQGQSANITVRFSAKLIHSIRSREGALIHGSTDTVTDVVELWTFARAMPSRDPNWQVVATGGAE